MIRWQKRFTFFLLVTLSLSALAVLQADDAKELNRRGSNELRSGNYKEAATLLEGAMKLSPNWAEPYYNYYQLLRQNKKAAEARQYLKKAYDMEPTNSTYRDEVVRLLKEDLTAAKTAGNKAKVEELQTKILQYNPEEVEVALPMVKKYFDAQEFDQMKALINQLLEKNKAELPKYASAEIGELFFYLARVEYDNKEYKAALEHAEKATRYPLDQMADAKELVGNCKKAFREMVDGYLAAGKAYMAKGNSVKAVEEFNKGLAIDPENEAILSQVELLDNKKQVNELIANANKLVGEQKWLEARDALEMVLRIQPKNMDAKSNLKKAIEFEEKYMKRLGKAEKLPRSSAERNSMCETFITMGKRYMEVKNYKEAGIAFERGLALIELDPKLEKHKAEIEAETSKIASVDNTKALWDKGREQYKNMEFEECLKTLNQLPQDYAVDLLSYMAYCTWKGGDKEKAKEYAHRQLEKQSDNNRAKFVLANIFHEGGDNGTANKLALEIKDSDPEYPGIDDLVYKTGALRWGPFVIPVAVVAVLLYIAYLIYNNLPEYYKNAGIKKAKSYLKQGMYKECIDQMIEVKKMPNVDAYDGAVISRVLAQCFLKCAAYEKAVGECKHLLAINPSDPEAHGWLGFAYLGRRIVSPESLPELLNLYKSEKNNKALVALLGAYYTSQKILSGEGVEVLERWYEFEQNNPDVLKSLGKFYLQKGRTDEKAMKVFESMMTTSKAEPEFMLGVAKLHLRLNNVELALKICETVLTMDVNNELVHNILRDCYRKTGKIADLIEIYRAFLAENPYNVAFQKGLTEAQKIFKVEGNVVREAPVQETVDLPPQVQLKENEVLCPHCGKVNINTDYYCQGCGQNIGQA